MDAQVGLVQKELIKLELSNWNFLLNLSWVGSTFHQVYPSKQAIIPST
jgi:hypothetical protein